MNLSDIQNQTDNKKARTIFKVLKNNLQSTSITERAGVSIYNYDINEAIDKFRNLALKAKTDKQFNSYYEIQELFKEIRKKGIK